tara:strand:- start:2789 stop:3154 length:366 start_codon:yes stop_codon:yes gene_type:complete
MKQVIQVTDLQTDSRVFSVQADAWNADVLPGQSIRIHGTEGNLATPRSIDRTYQVGELAVYDSYNLIYTGAIVSITAKTVTIQGSGTGEGRKRLPLAVFFSRNQRSIEQVEAHNVVERDCI